MDNRGSTRSRRKENERSLSDNTKENRRICTLPFFGQDFSVEKEGDLYMVMQPVSVNVHKRIP